MNKIETKLEGVYIIEPKVFGDQRGYFMETWSTRNFEEMGLRYARTLRDNGMFHIHNALNGKGERGLVAFGEKQLFWSSWASSCYLFLADRYGK